MFDSRKIWEHEDEGGSSLVATHLPCEDCGSSDALSKYSDNHTYCFSCNSYKKGDTMTTTVAEKIPEDTTLDSRGFFGPIEDRGITKETAKFYGVTCVLDENQKVIKHIYPYYRGNTKVAQKIRITANKQFHSEGAMRNVDLFGQQQFPPSKKEYIIVTEGELDAMAAYQMLGGRFPCVSLANGASAAERQIKEHLEYLSSFRYVVLAFDNDAQGQKATDTVAKLFGPNKCKVFKGVTQYKDACDYLKAGKSKEFVDTIYNSPVYTPAGIVDLYDLHDRFLEKRKRLEESNFTYPYSGLNEKTYGIRPSEFVILTADTGVGKTSFLREVQNHLLNTSDVKIGVMYIEEEVEDTYGLTFGIEVNKPIHLPSVRLDEKELQAARDKVGKGRVFVYEHFGSADFDAVLERIRYMVNGLGCQIIILDHISMLVSDQRYDDERRALDAISTKLKSLTIELGVGILAIVHTNREGQIRGSAMIEKLANVMIKLERDVVNDNEEERCRTKVVIHKNRFSGMTGPACTLEYKKETNRLVEV